ncbi:tetratricopeptide repeat protein 28-like [Pocillopora verrucosa]|uniref:tetratricopeptide repeat protein 28-like n=1 Tax=Pocillopora verrucosa TaxID=203993 RepID=UPI003341D406
MEADENLAAADNGSPSEEKIIIETQAEAAEENEDFPFNNSSVTKEAQVEAAEGNQDLPDNSSFEADKSEATSGDNGVDFNASLSIADTSEGKDSANQEKVNLEDELLSGLSGFKKESDDDDGKSTVGQQASSTAAVGSLDFADNSLSDKSEATSVEKKVDMKDAPLVVTKEAQVKAAEGNQDLTDNSSLAADKSEGSSSDNGVDFNASLSVAATSEGKDSANQEKVNLEDELLSGQFGFKKESDDDDGKSTVGQQASSTAAIGSLDFADNGLSDKSEATSVEKKVDMKDAPLVDQEKSQVLSCGISKDLEIGSSKGSSEDKVKAIQEKLDLDDKLSSDHFTSKKESDDDGSKPKVGKEDNMAADENVAAADNGSPDNTEATSGYEALDSNNASSVVIKETQVEAAEGNEDFPFNNSSENKTSDDKDMDLDDDPLVVRARDCFQQGNKEYRQGDFHRALQLYTEGLQLNCKDNRLTARLYNNRAAAHFRLENFENSLDDATVAVQLEPTFIKALEKGAEACVQLKLYDEAKIWCHKGLAMDDNSKRLRHLLNKCGRETIASGEIKPQQVKEVEIAKDLGDKTGEGRSYGSAYGSLGQFKTAIYYHKQDLEIAKEVGDKAGEGRSYGNLGSDYHGLGQFKTAIYYHKQDLEIAKEVGDKAGEGRSYGNLGSDYHGLGQFKTAIDYHKQHLEIAKEVGDKAGEGRSYGNLGSAYGSLGQFKTAIDYHKQDLEIAKEVGDKAGEGRSYGNLGSDYHGLGQFKTAIDYHKQDLEIAKEVGDKAGEGRSYGNLGSAYGSLGQFKTAIDYHKQDLEIAKEVGDKAGEGRSYGNLGNAYGSLGQFKTAIDYHKQDLEIAKEVGDKAGEGRSYGNLGNAYLGLGQFKTAIDYHKQHLEIAKEVGDKAGEGTSYGNLGSDYHGLGQFKTAIDYHKQDLEIAKEVGDKAGEGTSYGNLGSDYHCLGQFKTAIDYHKQHLEIAKEVGDKAGEGRSYGNLGNAYLGLGQFKTAIDYHKQHLEIAKEVGDKAGEGTSYGNLGSDYHGLGQFKTAIDYHKQDLEIAKEVGDKAGEGTSYGNLGSDYHCLGQFKTAIDYHKQHLEIAKEVGDKTGEGRSYGNLGNAYLGLGQFKTAIDYHKQHLEIAKEVGDKAGEGRSYGNLGSAYGSLGQFKTAIDYHKQHLEIAKEVGDKAGEGGSYGNLGSAYGSLGQFKTAIDYHKQHLEIAKEVGDKAGEGRSYGNLGSDYHGLGQFKTAIDYYKQDLEIAKEVGDKDGIAQALCSLATNFERLECLQTALDYYISSREIFNNVRASFLLHHNWKISYRNVHKTAYNGVWRVLLLKGEHVKALLAAEEGRAQALRDIVDLKYSFRQTLTWSNSRKCSDCLSLRNVSSDVVFLAITGPYIALWTIRNGEVVQSRIKHVNNFLYQRELEVYITSLNKAASLQVSARAAVEWEKSSTQVGRDEKGTSDGSPRNATTNALRKLYDIIVAPIADLIDGDELVFVPEGPLCLVPYAALVDSNSRYLCESFRIRVIPSLTILKSISDCPTELHNKTGALLVGDPCYKQVLYQGDLLNQLPGARKEVKMIGGILGIAPLVGGEATKEEVFRRISSVALVHIAAHGKKETGEILLAPNTSRTTCQAEEEDYLLTMRDVLRAGLRAKLVVLSCCHSACGEVMAEGVVGIARAFLGAGARSVLVSLWAIDDDGTQEFMKHFYGALEEGKGTSEAVNQAMKCMRESETFSKGYYWAPFVLIGDDLKLELTEIKRYPSSSLMDLFEDKSRPQAFGTD